MQLLLHPESDDSAQLSQVWRFQMLVFCLQHYYCYYYCHYLFLFVLQIETEKLLAHLVETEMTKRTVGYFLQTYSISDSEKRYIRFMHLKQLIAWHYIISSSFLSPISLLFEFSNMSPISHQVLSILLSLKIIYVCTFWYTDVFNDSTERRHI